MKSKLQFTVTCKPYYKNPIGYTRTTQKMKFSDKYKKYSEWKDYVWMFCWDEAGRDKEIIEFNDNCKKKVKIEIYFSDKKHPDPDNVFKALVDSLTDTKYEKRLWNDDKNISGEFDFWFDKENPRIEVEIFEIPAL